MLPRSVPFLVAAAVLMAGCELPPEKSRFEKTCAAVVAAFRDAAVQIAVEDCGTGQVRGSKDGIDVRANLRTLVDGSVRVEFHTSGSNQALIHQISRAYDERIGR